MAKKKNKHKVKSAKKLREKLSKNAKKKADGKAYDDALIPKVRERIDGIREDMESNLPHTLYGIDQTYYSGPNSEASDEDIAVSRDGESLAVKGNESWGDACEVGIYRLVDVCVFKNDVKKKTFEEAQKDAARQYQR